MQSFVPSPDQVQALLRAARLAYTRAYAPYSDFPVGAAVLDEHGVVHAGCNVENVAYPQGVCAEAGALSAMILAGGRGSREFCELDTPIMTASDTAVGPQYTLEQLMPHSFGPEHLARTHS